MNKACIDTPGAHTGEVGFRGCQGLRAEPAMSFRGGVTSWMSSYCRQMETEAHRGTEITQGCIEQESLSLEQPQACLIPA